ncbi:MAG: HEXXH motif-containing putative peptide modification protein [Gammaproteobacteria bacterium]|nr:HEXXH motif-containing putative peptide modification protein [Gammaproteobacteria bacterium]
MACTSTSRADQATEPVRETLWTSPAIYSRRHRKSASALLAVHNQLARQRPLGGREAGFLELVEQARSAPAEAFTRVWTDPVAYYWVRIAYELLYAVLNETPATGVAAACARDYGAADTAAALERHLHEFRRFALGIAAAGGPGCRFDEPYRAGLPFALPGSLLYVAGRGEIAVYGIDGDTLYCRHGDTERHLPLRPAASADTGPRVEQCPVAGVDDYRCGLNAAAFNNLPGMEFTAPVQAAGPAFQEHRVELVQQTLQVLRDRAPEVFAQFADAVPYIALKPLRGGDYTNLAHSELPGTFIAAAIDHPHEMADTFIHEFHHNRLFFLEETGPFFDETHTQALEEQRYYSPWRDDLRSLHGIYHAVYVFIPVTRFWLRVLAEDPPDDSLRAYAGERIARFLLQLRIGIAQIDRHAELTPYGEALFRQMAGDVAELEGLARAAGVDDRAAALACGADGRIAPAGASSVRADVLEHLARFAPRQQRTHLESRLAP